MVIKSVDLHRLTVAYLSLLGSWDKLTAARPEHVALRTRYERRNTIEAGIKGVGSAGGGCEESCSPTWILIPGTQTLGNLVRSSCFYMLIGTSPANGGRSVAGYVCLSEANKL